LWKINTFYLPKGIELNEVSKYACRTEPQRFSQRAAKKHRH